MKKRFWAYLVVVIGAALMVSIPVSAACAPAVKPEECASILPGTWCRGEGLWGILGIILDIMTMGVGVLATIGIVISGIQWLTSRDNESQVAKAKSRIFNIVIGILFWALLWLLLGWLLPGVISFEDPTGGTPAGDCPPGEWESLQPKPPSPGPSPTPPGDGGTLPPGSETSLPIGNPKADSSNIACDPRTVDLGVHDGWNNGVRTFYRMCSIPNLSSTTTAGYMAVLQKAGKTNLSGKAVLNSRVAGAVYSMAAAAKADGITLTAGSTFRSFEWQRDNCNLSSSQKDRLNAQRLTGKVDRICNKDSKMMAPPGYSNHQSGTAIDFTRSCNNGPAKGPCNTAMYRWLKANSTRFGFSQYVNEYWHYDTRNFKP
ncbi:D-alanyl-D-alanine carboxypeptidase family protein [Candidatus Saccharibacteria bacterium]|nr:D-alanyl-D-alanine carboxypeptidase family protein [Candidatus Saccharibacteria bacterium]